MMGIGLAFGLVSLSAAAPRVGEKAPDFTLKTIDGKTAQLSALYKEKMIFLNFFATWCGPCVQETPGIVKTHPAYKDRVHFLSVDLGEKDEAVRGFVKEHSIPFSIAMDRDGKVGDMYGVRYIPTNLIIDKEGNVVFSGSFLQEGELAKLLDGALGKTAPALAAPPQVEEKKRWWDWWDWWKKDKK